MILTKLTKTQIHLLNNQVIDFINLNKTLYNNSIDIIFILSSFERFFDDVLETILIHEEFFYDDFQDQYLLFSDIMTTWQSHLLYQLPTNKPQTNNIVDVLNAVVATIDTILADADIYSSEEQDYIPDETNNISHDIVDDMPIIEREYPD